MSAAIGFQCVACGRKLDTSEAEYVCPRCAGNLDVLYDYDRVARSFGKAQLAADRNLTIWRYRALLPIEPSSAVPPLTVGWTPVYDCRSLASQFGIKQLLIKD